MPSADRTDSVYVGAGCTGGSFIIITNECRYTNDLLCNRLSKWMAMEIKPHEVGPIPNRPGNHFAPALPIPTCPERPCRFPLVPSAHTSTRTHAHTHTH